MQPEQTPVIVGVYQAVAVTIATTGAAGYTLNIVGSIDVIAG